MRCDYYKGCRRKGSLVQEFPVPAQPHLGIYQPWVFRFYLCRWHRGAENRNRGNQEKLMVLGVRSDETVLKGLETGSLAQSTSQPVRGSK